MLGFSPVMPDFWRFWQEVVNVFNNLPDFDPRFLGSCWYTGAVGVVKRWSGARCPMAP